MKHSFLKHAALALLAGFSVAACSDDDQLIISQPVPGETGAYVVCQGSMGVIDGAIDHLSAAALSSDTVSATTPRAFYAANGQSLGDTPQRAHAYGSKLYVPMTGSNLVWVLNKQTLKIVGSIPTTQPQSVCGTNGKIFVSGNDGYVTAFDTLTLAPTSKTAVGPNPTDVAVIGTTVYAAISDGYNYANGYVNGFKVAKLDATTGEKLGDIAVGMNPYRMVACPAAGALFVVCQGNYADVAAKVMKIEAATDRATDLCEGTLVATNGTTVYVVNSVTDYSTYTTTVTGSAYNALSGGVLRPSLFPADHTPLSPTALDVNPATDDIFVCGLASAYGYSSPGVIDRYSADGTFRSQMSTGVQPYGIVFF